MHFVARGVEVVEDNCSCGAQAVSLTESFNRQDGANVVWVCRRSVDQRGRTRQRHCPIRGWVGGFPGHNPSYVLM